MNYLEIAKAVNIASGLQGDVDTVVSPTGIQRSLLGIINSAYLDIQMLSQDWAWLRTSGSFSWHSAATSQADPTIHKYTLVYYNYKPLTFVPYETWILEAHNYAVDIPKRFTIIPETNGIVINPVSQYYVINYRAIKAPETLTSNTQVPHLPALYHNIIVYKAAYEVGLFLGNGEIMNLNLSKYEFLLGSLMRSQNLPKKITQRPLV